MAQSFIEIHKGDISVIQASYNHTNTKNGFPPQVHNDSYEMMLFESGNVIYFIDDRACHLMPGDVTLICPTSFHGVRMLDTSTYSRYPMHFGKDIVSSLCTENANLLSCFHNNKSHLVHLNEPEMKQYIHYCMQIIHCLEKKQFGWDIQIKSYLALALVLVNQAHSHSSGARRNMLPQIVKSAIQYVDSHLTDELNVQTIADELNISRSRLMHLFKEHTDLSLWSYVTAKRIILAKDLLQQGATVTDACYSSGFNDYGHFIKAFTKNEGITPGKFTRLHQEKYPMIEVNWKNC